MSTKTEKPAEPLVVFHKKETLSCSNCGKSLMHVVVTKEDKEIDYRFIAKCPFCGDGSYAKAFHGILKIGSADYVELTHTEQKDEFTIFHTKKVENKHHE